MAKPDYLSEIAVCEYFFDKTCPTLITVLSAELSKVSAGDVHSVPKEDIIPMALNAGVGDVFYDTEKKYCRGKDNYQNCHTYKFIKKIERLASKLTSISV